MMSKKDNKYKIYKVKSLNLDILQCKSKIDKTVKEQN